MSDHDHHEPSTFLTKYVFSTDHKVIAQQFLYTSLLFVILGSLFALGVRYQLAWPQQDVPYKWLLPGKMTSEAPEPNVSLWDLGGEVEFLSAVSGVPEETKGELVDLPNGLAITVPVYTVIEDNGGRVVTLNEARDGYVRRSAVMGDYDYKRTDVRAIAGTQVTTSSGETLTIVGREELQLDASGAAAPTTHTDFALLPVQAAATEITVVVDGRKITTTADKVKFEKDLLTTDAYLQLFTMHASIMIFFVIIPTLVGFFGNWTIPLMIGARDMAFPKINMLSFWLSFSAGLVMLLSFWTMGGPAGGGWTMYPPLAERGYGFGANSDAIGTTLWIVSVGLVGFGSVIGALNYITTIINMRAPGMNLFRMPLVVWSLFITSGLILLGTPVLTAAAVLLLFDRHLGTQFFMPAGGGQPLLFQHLFWFYSHPAVYIMILPAMGVTSDVLATFSRKPIFGYKPMVFAMAAITGLGFIVWGHHMFQSGMNPVLGTTFMASTIMIAVPSAIKTFNWLGTIWGGNVKFTPAMLNALAFVSMFVVGGLSGIFMASTPIDIQIHDTYFIVAHIHYVLFGGSIFGIFAAIYYWFPKMYGRQLNQKWGVIHLVMNMIAFNGTFFLMHILGVGGHPRRYASIMEYPTLMHLQDMNVIMSLWAISLGCAQLPFFFSLWASMPRRLGRSLAAFFLVMITAPIAIGLTFWSAADGALPDWCAQHLVGPLVTLGGNSDYSGLGLWGGRLLAIAGVFWLTRLLLRQLPRGGRIATFCTMGPLCIYTVVIAFTGRGMSEPQLVENAHALQETMHLLHVVFWSPLTHDVLVAIGWGVLWGAIVTGIVHAIWAVGGALGMPKILGNAMYVVFVPLFLSPFIFKPDSYVMLGVPGLQDYAWPIAILLAIPGLAYLIVRRLKDEFGYAVDTNPWQANTLDWTATTSPPAHLNFDEIPTVYRGPYEYSSPAVEKDWLPQEEQLPPGVVEPADH